MIPESLWPLANHLWQSTLFAGTAGLMTLAFRKNRAATRYWIWLAASVKFLIPLSLLVALGSQIGSRTAPAAARPGLPAVIEEIGQPFTVPLSSRFLVNVPVAVSALPTILLTIWGCVFFGIALTWWRQWRRVGSAVREGTRLPFDLDIPVISSPAHLGPGVFGICRPVLLLPKGILTRLTAPQIEAVIAHELCHVRRHDNPTAAIQMLIEAIFWFHPLVWWIGTRLMDERERACDEEVVRLGSEPRIYAQSILSVCEFYLESPVACVAGVTGSDLKRRIKEIVKNASRRELTVGRKLLLATAGLLAVAGPLIVGIVHAPAVRAQSAKFEVAAIRPSEDDGGHDIHSDKSRFTTHNATLKRLIAAAYDIDIQLISGGTNWVDSAGYDINAKIPAEFVQQRDKLPLMLQSLLAERFKLVIHREPIQISGYALVASGKGPKMERAATSQTGSNMHTNNAHLTAEGVTMETFAKYLSRNRDIGKLVVNKTGLNGAFNFKLDWKPEPLASTTESPSDLPSIFAAIQQLGLKLESAKVPIMRIVIDHAEKPDAN